MKSIFRILVVLVTTFATSVAALAEERGPQLLRDAEIEGLLRLYARPIFKAAGLNPGSIKVHLIGDPSINAFVAEGQRVFVHTGLITQTDNPNQVIGVMAHETGHIAGGHLARMNDEIASASKERILGMLIGAAAVAAGAATGSSSATQAGRGVIMGAQGMAQRNLLSYARSMESTADQSALRYLNATGQSPKGMITVFEKLASKQLVSARGADPYLFSHPMPLERIRALETEARKSPVYDAPDNEGLQLRHDLAKAKIAGFLESPQVVFRRYPKTNDSLPSRYARSISMFIRGDIKNAMPIIDTLIRDMPKNPYFWELKGQAYLENGNAQAALTPLTQAQKLLPNNGLMQILYATALVNVGTDEAAAKALKVLILARKTEGGTAEIFKLEAQAHATRRDIPRAELATAEYAWATGDKPLATDKAKRALSYFKQGSREWLRANDLLLALKNK